MKKDNKCNRSFARRLTLWVMLVLFIMMSALGLFIYRMTKGIVIDFTGNIFHSNMQASAKFFSNVTSDVGEAVTNYIYGVEQHLNQPQQLQEIINRMVKLNPRVRSCEVLNVEDHADEEWCREAMANDSAYWTEPFFDSSDGKTPLVAYHHPLHDSQGNVVAFLRTCLSLEFMTQQLERQDSIFINDLWLVPVAQDGKIFNSYVITRDGTYVTHHDRRRILKGRFYPHIKDADEPGTASKVINDMQQGKRSNSETDQVLKINRINTYLFYIPVEQTDWVMAVTVSTISLDIFGVLMGAFMLLVIGGMMIVMFLVCRFTIKRAVNPLIQLAGAADEVAGGQFDAELPVIRSRDELQLLRDSFENMQHSLVDYVEELKNATASKASLESELKIAHDIQMSMLPKTYPAFPDRNDLDIYGFMMPAKAVGGDLYDFFIRDEKLFFCIGDVSGKGVPASLLMAVTRFLFRNIAAYTQEPNYISDALNHALSSTNETGMFVTFFLGVLDLQTGLLSFSNAGHNPPYVLSRGQVRELKCDTNIPVGVVPDWQFTAQSLQLATGDCVFLYTDGLNEAEDCSHQQFGTSRMMQVATNASSHPQRIIEAMSTAVKFFIGDAEQSDDLTMLAVEYIKQEHSTGDAAHDETGGGISMNEVKIEGLTFDGLTDDESQNPETSKP